MFSVKIQTAIQAFFAWLLGFILSIFPFWVVIVALCFFDRYCGIKAARFRGDKIQKSGLRRTVEKVSAAPEGAPQLDEDMLEFFRRFGLPMPNIPTLSQPLHHRISRGCLWIMLKLNFTSLKPCNERPGDATKSACEVANMSANSGAMLTRNRSFAVPY